MREIRVSLLLWRESLSVLDEVVDTLPDALDQRARRSIDRVDQNHHSNLPFRIEGETRDKAWETARMPIQTPPLHFPTLQSQTPGGACVRLGRVNVAHGLLRLILQQLGVPIELRRHKATEVHHI